MKPVAETLGTTEEHPFYVDGKGWVEAADLTASDLVVSHASGEGLGGFLRIKAVVLEDARQDTYNFEVADTHTYFVGQLNAWVHNACDPGDLLANGGQYLGDDKTTMVGVHGSLFEKLPDGTFENIRPATAEEIELAGVVVQPLDASVGTNSFALNSIKLDANVTWKPDSSDIVDFDGLPVYDGRNTLGKLEVGGESYYVKNGRGRPGLSLYDNPSIKAGAVSHSHAEGHAAAIIRNTGAKSGTISINNPNGPCGFCDKVIENMQPEGTSLTVNWPNGSHKFVGNVK